MSGVLEWVGNIVCYLIFMTVLTGILPAGRYEKYIRLFAGCVLILIVIQPLTGSLRLEDKIRHLFQTISFENEMEELQGQFGEMERKRMTRLVEQYEEATAAEVSLMAEKAGFTVQSAEVEIEPDGTSENFGKIRKVRLAVGDDGIVKNKGETAGSRRGIFVETLEPVQIENIGAGMENDIAAGMESDIGTGSDGQSSEVSANPAASAYPMEKLREQIASFYQMEAEHVEIRMED